MAGVVSDAPAAGDGLADYVVSDPPVAGVVSDGASPAAGSSPEPTNVRDIRRASPIRRPR